MKMKSIR